MTDRRIVITGIGTVTPVGIGNEEFWDSLSNGKSGIGALDASISLNDISIPEGFEMPVKIGGEVKNFDMANYFDDPKAVRNANKDMDRFTQFAVVASKLAVEDSGVNFDDYDRTKAATFIGTGIGGISTTCNDGMTLNQKGLKRLGIRSIIRLMPNAASGQVAIQYGLQGRAKSDSTACASGLDSLVDAYHYMKSGMADVMISGGAEACMHPLAISSFANMTALSKRDGDPTKVSCPFDKRRDGFVMSEGAVIFVLETLERAEARGAKIYAELAGVGGSCDAYHITAPSEDGSGGARAMEMALECAGIADQRERVSYIHAHGTSTPLNDHRETLAVKKVFGDHAYKLAMSSTKSMTGHMIGAAGPCGVAATCFAMRDSLLPPTINYEEPDPECDLNYVPNKAQEAEIDHALVQALGFGGHNTVVCLKKV